MSEQLLAAVTQYGAPALFAIAAIAAVGVPLPMTLLLIVVGSLVSQGVMDVWLAIGLASTGSILGDLAGYAIGRWGGPAAIAKAGRLIGKSSRLDAMEAKARAWGGPGILFTRWPLAALGPWINLASGAAGYPWHRFLLWDALGETTEAVLLILLGRFFSDQVMALDGIVGELTWTMVALAAAVILGVQFVKLLRRKPNVPPINTDERR